MTEKNINYQPKYVYMELSNFCNLQCKHCFAEAVRKNGTTVEKEKMIEFLHIMKQRNNFSIRFGGGEPLLVPYLCELIKFCSDQGIGTAITTNGLLLDKIKLNDLKVAGLKELTISIDGLENNHDFIRGKGNYKKVVQKIELCQEIDLISVSLAYTVTSKNYWEIEKFLKVFYKFGIKKFFFFRYCHNCNEDIFKLDKIQLNEAAQLILKCEQLYPDLKIIYEPLSFYSFLLKKDTEISSETCNFLKNVMTVKYNGDVVVCAAIQKVLGNLYEETLDDIYMKIESEKERLKEMPMECENCKYINVCHGGCKSNSFNHFFNYKNKDKGCYIED